MKSHATFPKIWSSDKARETVRLYFIGHAVNVLLDGDAKINVTVAGAMAAVVQMLGNYDPESQSVTDFFLLKNMVDVDTSGAQQPIQNEVMLI